VTGAAKDILDLVADEILDVLPRGAEVFARIEFARLFREHLADAGGHGDAQVGVNVDLRAAVRRATSMSLPARPGHRASCRRIC